MKVASNKKLEESRRMEKYSDIDDKHRKKVNDFVRLCPFWLITFLFLQLIEAETTKMALDDLETYSKVFIVALYLPLHVTNWVALLEYSNSFHSRAFRRWIRLS